MAPRWTPDDDQFLRDNFKNLSLSEIALGLSRTEKAIRHRATTLKLTIPCPHWTAQEDALLKKLYNKLPPQEIAEKMGKTSCAICHRATRLKITKPRRCWTDEEIAYLEDNWGKVSVEKIARRLSRTDWGVIDMAVRVLALGPTTEYQGYLTSSCLGGVLGVNSWTTRNWIKRHGLKARFTTVRRSRKIYQIDVANFWKWAEHNQHRFDSRKFEEGMLGKEPDWMREKRRRDWQVVQEVVK